MTRKRFRVRADPIVDITVYPNYAKGNTCIVWTVLDDVSVQDIIVVSEIAGSYESYCYPGNDPESPIWVGGNIPWREELTEAIEGVLR